MRGAFHIHTTRSDGALDKRAVASAARRAGLQFAIFTDHGDATRTPDPPEYLDGVLCIDAVEVSTNGGHYIALGLTGASPYPLGGDADAVVEDVARLGGFGVVAHPMSARGELAWSDWDVSVDAIEWLNADSEWRDESRTRLGRTLIDYFWRPAGALASLLDRPVSTLARWDEIASHRRILALAGHDAHGGLGAETDGTRGRRFHLPSYEATFRTFSLNVVISRPPSGNAVDDADELLRAMRGGDMFTVIDALAAPGFLDFTATAGDLSVKSGGVLPLEKGRVRFTAAGQLPDGATIVLLRNGRPIAETTSSRLEHEASEQGAYRAEVRVPGAPGQPPVPWLVGNPIFRFGESSAALVTAPVFPVLSLDRQSWRAEVSSGSSATVAENQGAVTFEFSLRSGEDASQFAALVHDLAAPPAETAFVSFRGRAARPMRFSVQLRFAQDGMVRWRTPVYLGPEEREVVLPVVRFRPADGNGARPAIGRVTSLLFVVDLTNAAPGTQGSFTLSDVALAR